MRRPIALAAAGALAVGGTALAAPGGGPIGTLFRAEQKDREAEFSRDLASRLDGVSAEEVRRALEDLRRDRRAEHRRELARGLAGKLDGVSAADVESALEKAEAQAMRGFRRGRPPREGLAGVLARELGKSEREVRRALRAFRRERFEAKLDEAVKEGRITERQADRIRERFRDGPGPFGPGIHRHRRFGRGPGPGPGFGPGGPPGPGFAIPVP